jgi:hypothetical protein
LSRNVADNSFWDTIQENALYFTFFLQDFVRPYRIQSTDAFWNHETVDEYLELPYTEITDKYLLRYCAIDQLPIIKSRTLVSVTGSAG